MQGRPITYVGYYDTQANGAEMRTAVLAATGKMDYIISVLTRAGRQVQVVSASYTRDARSYRGQTVVLPNGATLRLFHTSPWGGKLRRVISMLTSRILMFTWLMTNTGRGDDVLVYHSLGYMSEVALARRVRGFRLILEVEEVYGDVTGRRRDREREYRLFARADAFVFPTELLNRALNSSGKPYVIVHGTYNTEADTGASFADGRIHVVYAGTLDPRKGGASSAAAAAEFLDDRYHIHVIGFGNEDERRSLMELIDAVQARTDCRVSFDGLKAGDEYKRFVQSCSIGLSTQIPDAAFSVSSFPSKVLSYLSNGVHVVSIRLKVLEESAVGDLVHYYDEDDPRAIAEAIRHVDLAKPYDSRQRLAELDAQFSRELEEVLAS